VNAASIDTLLLGAIAVANFAVGLVFLRYWLSTRDRLFVFLMLSFWIEAANRVVMGVTSSWQEDSPVHYVVRLAAYLLIVVAIWDKNRTPRR
jgi:hypothetical protein